jgi:hypothetical protein
MDVLKAELERKKREMAARHAAAAAAAAATAAAAGGSAALGPGVAVAVQGGGRVFVRAADVEGALRDAPPPPPPPPTAGGEEAGGGHRPLSPKSPAADVRERSGVAEAAPPVSDAVVKAGLRSAGHVVTYYGETALQRRRRWEGLQAEQGAAAPAATASAQARGESPAAGSGVGSKRPAAAVADLRAADGAGDGAEVEEGKRRRVEGVAAPAAAAVSSATSPPPSEAVPSPAPPAPAAVVTAAGAGAGAGDAGGGGDAEEEGKAFTSRDAEAYRHKDPARFMYKFFRGLLHEWEAEVAARTPEEAATLKARDDAALLKQSKQYMRPFFAKARAGRLPADIVKHSAQMAALCLDRKYRQAGDVYVTMAIGNAAWPLGVTRVGLHERAAREKVQEGKAGTQSAHILADEEARKSLTTLKRLVTVCQARYPTNPSDCLFS